jgi:hypothetical protein
MAHQGWRRNVLRTPETLLGPYGHINLSFRLDFASWITLENFSDPEATKHLNSSGGNHRGQM